MSNDSELPKIADEPTTRRLWLLSKALKSVPLDRAIELARTADEFLTAGQMVQRTIDVTERKPASKGEPVQAAQHPTPEAPSTQEPKARQTGLALSLEPREQLLDRLAVGATNAELAREFGLGARQVQGIRMGAAREIANRRNRQSKPLVPRAEDTPASPEEVVRYLRQQDDVVVPQDEGEFLVNGRFRLTLAELLSRANRMRSRQGKPEFKLANGGSSRAAHSVANNPHPIFWKEQR
jgi:DNA-binding CsgD family transcriptional regulator